MRSAAVPGTELLIAYDSFYPWRIYHEQYNLCACRTAAADWRYRGDSHHLRDGSCALLQVGEMHANTHVYKYSDFKVAFFERALVAEAARELGLSPHPSFRMAQSDDPSLFAAVYTFCAAVEEGAEALEQQSRMTMCIHRMLALMEERPVESGTRAKRAIQLAMEHIRQRLDENVTLDDLVAVSGLSRFHLLRCFAARAGMPPHAYQIRLRVARAMRLLRGGLPVGEVASLVGFADQSHFTRHFRRIWRVTPGQYVRATCSHPAG